MIHMGCSVYRMSDGSFLAISVPTMYVGCSIKMEKLIQSMKIVLVPAMYVGCSFWNWREEKNNWSFSTRDVRGL